MCSWWLVKIIAVPILAISLMLADPGYSPSPPPPRVHYSEDDDSEDMVRVLEGLGTTPSTVCDNMCDNPNFRHGLLEQVRMLACSHADGYVMDIAVFCMMKKMPMNMCGVQNELANCLYQYYKQVAEAWPAAVSAINSEMGQNVQRTFLLGWALPVQQKEFIRSKILEPVCLTYLPLGRICEEPKNTFLAQANLCRTDFMVFEQAMINNSVQNLCRNGGSWILDIVDANLHECAADILRMWKSPSVQKRVQDYHEINQFNPTQKTMMVTEADLATAKHKETIEGLCNYVRTIISIASDVLVTSCKANPQPGQMIWNAFNDTLNFWKLKCRGFSYKQW